MIAIGKSGAIRSPAGVPDHTTARLSIAPRGRPIRLRMGSLALAGVACLIVTCAVVGLRLLALGVRGRQLPELALAATYLLFGAIGYPLGAFARALAATGDSEAGGWLAAALAIQNFGIAGVYFFVGRVFRPDGSGPPLAVLGAVALGASWMGHAFDPGFEGAHSIGPWYYLGLATRAAAFVWGAAEAFSYWGRLRRRVAIGLADPVVANRMWLWGASSAWIAVAFGVFTLGTFTAGGVNATPIVLALSACGIAAAAAMMLAFFPPARYRRWLIADAAVRAAQR
jgi:hypothetical protein